jgi:hypothetical protein
MSWEKIPSGGLAALLEKILELHRKHAELMIKRQIVQAQMHVAIQTEKGSSWQASTKSTMPSST